MRYLLLQARNSDDPMRQQEVSCFARAIGCGVAQISIFDLLAGMPGRDVLERANVVLLGGSGDYSVAEGGSWLDPALQTMRTLFETDKPTFASCWGFQAMARALGGQVVTDLANAELGSVEVFLTPEGHVDPLFSSLGDRFLAQMGHQDRVDQLPRGAVRLASSQKVENQAFCFPGKPIYCTQFHPELNRQALLQRVGAYPWYVEKIAGIPANDFGDLCQETPATDQLLRRFVQRVEG